MLLAVWNSSANIYSEEGFFFFFLGDISLQLQLFANT